MDDLTQLLSFVLTRARTVFFRADVVGTFATLVLFLFAIVIIEAAQGRNPRRYLSRSFRTDAAYTLFYFSGLYAILVWAPIFRILERLTDAYVPAMRVDLLGAWPAAAHIVAFMLVTDLIGYWKHRWMHSNRILWAFHSIHHSQQNLTFATSYRSHLVDELMNNLTRFVPGLVLGVPVMMWVPLTVAMTLYQSVQHSDTGWSYGKLDRVFVSARFHSVHHSTERVHYDRNFGFFFSFWDVLFGTSYLSPRRPASYGVKGLSVPESVTGQLVFPFVRILADLRQRRGRESSMRTGPA